MKLCRRIRLISLCNESFHHFLGENPSAQPIMMQIDIQIGSFVKVKMQTPTATPTPIKLPALS